MMRKIGNLFAVLFIFIIAVSGKLAKKPYEFPTLKFFPKMPISPLNPVTEEGVNLGRHLFYDPVLSSDSNLSCAGCHRQAYAFSDSPNQFSKGRNGSLMKRNTMPLFNLAWYPAFFWDGKANSIEEQISHPLKATDEMNLQWPVAVGRLSKNNFYKKLFSETFENGIIDSAHITNAIAQFLRTLLSYQSKYDQVASGHGSFSHEEYAGFVLMNDQTKADCLHCHTTDADGLGTTLQFSNNGLEEISDPMQYIDRGRGGVTGKISDYGKFMIPSLRNVLFTAPYMHDGRFKTLEEVLDFYSSGVKQSVNIDSKMEFAHKGGANLTSEEKRCVIAFLKTMTDFSFVTNTEFSNPFEQK